MKFSAALLQNTVFGKTKNNTLSLFESVLDFHQATDKILSL